MTWVIDLLGRVSLDVARTFDTVWPFLTIAILLAAAIPVYVGLDRVASLLQRRWWVATIGAVGFATLTPFCSCGTMAVLLGMIASSTPWAPLVAFMVSSPLTSPSELVFSAGLFGWRFALLFFGGTIALGVVAGLVANVLESLGWLDDQTRSQVRSENGGGTGAATSDEESFAESNFASVKVAAPPATRAKSDLVGRLRLREYGSEVWSTGRRLVALFFAFTAVGYLMIEAIPTAWLQDNLGGDSLAAVPLAALLGIPAYINTEGSLPLVATMVDNGMGSGPALAFIVTGAGTSVGAISGLLIIARARVVALVLGLLFAGAVVLGWIGQVVV